MFKIKKYSIRTCLLLLILLSVHLQAQVKPDPPKTGKWTLAECIAYAEDNNITLNSLKYTAQTSQQTLLQSQNAKYPNLNGSLSQGGSHGNSGFSTNSNFGLNSSVTLYNGGYQKNDVKSKELALQAANLDIITSENDIILQITQAYLNILLAKENILYIRDLISTSEAQVKQGEQKNTAGTIARKDLLQLEASLANDKYSLVTAENTRRQNILTLKQILQLPTEQDFDIETPDTLKAPVILSDLSTVQQTAQQIMPQVKSSELALQQQDYEIEKVKAGLRPSLNANGSLSSNYSKAANSYNAFNNEGYFNQLNKNFYQQLGLTLSIPLLDRKVTSVNLAKANIQKKQAMLNLQNVKTELNQTVEKAYITMINAEAQLAAAQETLKYSSELYRIANDQLRIGVFNNVEYIQAKDQYIQAEQSMIQAKYSTQLYQKIYNFYKGIPVTQ